MALIVSLIIIGLYALGQFGLGFFGNSYSFFVPLIVVIFAGATAIYSLFAYFLAKKDQAAFAAGLIAFVALSLTVTLLIAMTGGLHSPFVGLWLVIAVSSGLFGASMLGGFIVATNTYGIFNIVTGSESGGNAIILMLIINLPLIVSVFLWYQKRPSRRGEAEAVSSMQKELSQEATKAGIIINSIADGVVVVDAKNIINLLNPAAEHMLGWAAGDAIGLDYRSVIKLTDEQGNIVADDLSPVHQVMASNKLATNNDYILVTKSGKKTMVSTVVSPIGNSSQAGGVIVVLRDITREKEQERQKAEFISTASHEMRTPVAAIEGYLGLAMNPQTAAIDDKARLYLQKAHESTQHLGRLFQDLLTVSKAEDARIIPKQQPTDIIAFAREVTDAFAFKAKEKGIYLNFAPGESGGDRRISPIYFAYVDPDHLREILSNLVDNAIKYTQKGTVTVDITGDNDNILISVTDTGIGIPPEDVPHLFQKFYRVDNSDTREIGGTGLGLFISRRLTEANNGHISAKSSFGKGSTFTVQFPRISGDQVDKTQQSQQHTPQQQPAERTAASITPPPPPSE